MNCVPLLPLLITHYTLLLTHCMILSKGTNKSGTALWRLLDTGKLFPRGAFDFVVSCWLSVVGFGRFQTTNNQQLTTKYL